MNMKDRTIVALVSIVVIGGLLAMGHNSSLPGLLGVILGFYFGREVGEPNNK